ncbi:MAG: glycosyl transferase family 1 [Pseudomonas sp.]|nr:glycosyl transferase family 1 [Pseudomonas sp.]
MRVALDYRAATGTPSSGIARQIKALEQALHEREDTELLLMSEAPLEHPQRLTALCPAWPSPLNGLHRPPIRLRFERTFLPAAIREHSVDLYIATANMGLPIGKKPTGTRYVLILHDLFQLTLRNFHRSRLTALAYRLVDAVSIAWSIWVADEVWCPSRFSCSEAARLFPWARSKFRVLDNLVPQYQGTLEALPQGMPARYWLAVGTREPRKNIAFLVEHWHACRLENPRVPELVLVGHASDLPSALGNLSGLHWVSGVSDGQLQALYINADCLWQPSYAEGFGLPVVEALWHGTPVAVARGSALDEVTPPEARRFGSHDCSGLKTAIMEQAMEEQKPDPETLRDWARQFAEPAYRQRLDTLLKGLHH